MKEMESLTVCPLKPEERPQGDGSFLLVDEQENLQVMCAAVNARLIQDANELALLC